MVITDFMEELDKFTELKNQCVRYNGKDWRGFNVYSYYEGSKGKMGILMEIRDAELTSLNSSHARKMGELCSSAFHRKEREDAIN